MNNTFYVITPFFNPFGFHSRKRLYKEFAQHMKESGAQLVTIEVAFADCPFEVTTKGEPFNYQVRTSTIMFHKERAINLARQRLTHDVPDVHYIGWFDGDVSFADPEWVTHTKRSLDHHKIIQPFSVAVNLNAHEEYMWHCPGSIYSYLEGRGYHQKPPLPFWYIYKGHPGLAWAATAEALDQIGGLYDTCVPGSADTVMSNCLKGDYSVYLPAPVSPGFARSMKAWQDKCDKYIRGSIGYARGTILHHWHGKSEDRGYEKRWSIASFHGFDPSTDIELDSYGLYRWAGNKPALEQDMFRSLSSRNEDSL